MSQIERFVRRLKLRHFLFLLLIVCGIVPLAVSSFLLIRQNREILETQEKSYLTRSAEFLSLELSGELASHRRRLAQLGASLLAVPNQAIPSQAVPSQAGPGRGAPGEGLLDEKLRQPWLVEYLQSFVEDHPSLVALRVLDPQGVGPAFAPADMDEDLELTLDEAFEEAGREGTPIYGFHVLAGINRPAGVLAVPVADSRGGEPIVLESVVRLRPLETAFTQEAQGNVAVFLIDHRGVLLWSAGSTPGMDRAMMTSRLVQDFVRSPLNMTQEYTLEFDGKSEEMLGRASPVPETGWGVVVHRPRTAAFAAVQEMIVKTLLSTAILVVVALLVAAFAARKVGEPIQRLADTTHEIAAGHFGKRAKVSGVGREITGLAEDFNRMSSTVESYVARLTEAAQANRELFIGSMRAFVATVDAKDPYTRGHSERVAAHSRTMAKFLGLSEELQYQIWIGALLHDVGKIGIDDAILKKGGILTDEEYEQMKLHPVVGAQIMSRIDQLKEMIPAIRWHHEAWNGSGYPDGLRGEQIPLMARIVGIADTFDAITTNRPYQKAYEPDFAVETITKLAGSRYDAKMVTAFLRAYEAGEIQVRSTMAPPVEAEAPAVTQPLS